jgi:excisionase family DNA binding protein
MTKEAAEYTGTPANYLLNQAKMGHLSYIQPSPKRIMFDRDDLDAWMASWKVVKAIPATA